jgi:hypothetical protein
MAEEQPDQAPPQAGSPEWMLDKLNDEGAQCESDYDDGADGWFGWRVANPSNYGKLAMHTLIVRWTPDSEDGVKQPMQERRWRMLAVPEGTM